MIFNLKDYQRNAVDKLKGYIILSLQQGGGKRIVFKAPTGSGKTFTVAALLEELASENNDTNFCVLWACPGTGELHKQSYDAVKKYLGGNPVCSLLEDDFFGGRKYIKNKEIGFINWEKLVKKDKDTGTWGNNLTKDQEGQNFLDLINKTKANGTKIFLVVDESHIGSNYSTRIKEFRETIIDPFLTLEMSATPISDRVDVEIDAQSVIDEGMIKESIIINEGIKEGDRNLEEIDSETLVLEKGFKKREELKREYDLINSIVNPLVLIQIPNVEEGEAKKARIRDFLKEKGITEENGKLKFWLVDSEPIDKTGIRNNSDITEYLVFKTAVATGWDCPRAHILIKFRDSDSETFEIQTVGRILRTAEAKSYSNIILDNAYIYTNIRNFETKENTYSPNKLKTITSYFKKPHTKISVSLETQLTSFYRSRVGNYNSTDSRFNGYFERKFMDFFGFIETDKHKTYDDNANKFLKKGFILDVETSDLIIKETNLDAKIIDIEQKSKTATVKVKMSENDVQSAFYEIINSNLNGLAFRRSKDSISSTIVDIFTKFYSFPFKRSEKIKFVQRIFVNNPLIFGEIMFNATAAFSEFLNRDYIDRGTYNDFVIEDKRSYSTETHLEIKGLKSLYQPLYVAKDVHGNINQLEKDFLSYLDLSDKVDWYWENGAEHMRVNFGISYDNNSKTFQPDFIVKFADGTIGIFDTKGIGQRVEDTKIKAEALYDYLMLINGKRDNLPNVVGGIVIKVNNQFFIYCEKEYYDYDENRTNWYNFNEILRKINKKTNYDEVVKKISDSQNE